MYNKQLFHFINSKKWVILIIFSLSMLFCPATYAQDQEVKIGVLALRGAEESMERWAPTAEYLSSQVPGYKFVIVPLNFEEIFQYTKSGDVDFVLENSGIYIQLEYLYGIDRIATMTTLQNTHTLNEFGGVIFTNKKQKDVRDLKDLKGKSFMAVHETSFGGWITSQREFNDCDVKPCQDFSSLQFGGTHDAVVYAVQRGEVSAGTVRTGILEKMDEEGKINIEDFIIINQQYPDDFPLLISTRLYPEWPFARVKHTSDKLSKQVSVALLNMPSNSLAAKTASIAGWTIPHHYQKVHECFKDLRIKPYEDFGKITLTNLLKQFGVWILSGFIVILVILIKNRALGREVVLRKKVEIKLKKAHNELEIKVKERTVVLASTVKKLEKSKETIKKEKDFTDSAINAQIDTFFVFNAKTRKAVTWNKAFKNVSGYSNKEIKKLKIPNDYYNKEDSKNVIASIKKVLEGKTITLELNFITKSKKKIPYEYSASLLKEGKKNLIVVVGRDIVKRKINEERIEGLNALKNKFIEIIAHQLRTPLSGIKWTLESLAETKLKSDQKALIKKAYEADELIINRINDLLTVLDIEENHIALKKEKISIESLWISVMGNYQKDIDMKNIKFKYTPPKKSLPLIKVDPEKIRIVYSQLMRNAIDYSKKNSQITTKLLFDKNKITFKIKDTGIGIPKAEQSRIFTMFYRATNASTMVPNQSGVGLAICKHYIEKHGGKIGFNSKEGQGSTFWFEMPIK